MDELYQNIFDETYEATLSGLHVRAAQTDFSIDMVQNELQSLYTYEGLGWAGRGDVKQAEIEGSILAYQAFISRYRSNEL